MLGPFNETFPVERECKRESECIHVFMPVLTGVEGHGIENKIKGKNCKRQLRPRPVNLHGLYGDCQVGDQNWS